MLPLLSCRICNRSCCCSYSLASCCCGSSCTCKLNICSTISLIIFLSHIFPGILASFPPKCWALFLHEIFFGCCLLHFTLLKLSCPMAKGEITKSLVNGGEGDGGEGELCVLLQSWLLYSRFAVFPLSHSHDVVSSTYSSKTCPGNASLCSPAPHTSNTLPL